MTLPRPRLRHDGGDALRTLLGADSFRLGRDTARVATNLAAHGGRSDDRALCYVGSDLPPHGAPSISLGAARGTIGPHSFGFLDNNTYADAVRRPAAPFAAPLPARPRSGPIALVCGRRDALPDVAPLAVARGLGVSWIVSVGDGDVQPALRFLAEHEGTRAVLLAAGAGSAPSCLAALGGKPAVVLGGDPLLRAAARRHGGAAVDGLEAWFAHGALLESGLTRPERVGVLVLGGGALLVEQAARAVGLDLPVRSSDDEPEAAAEALAEARKDWELVLLASSEPQPFAPGVLHVDPGHPDRLRALFTALAEERTARPLARSRGLRPPDGEHEAQARAVLDEAGAASGVALSDHDTKRVLKAWGLRVSRQAPAASPTAAARIATQIGLPVDVVAGSLPADAPIEPLHESLRTARTATELRRCASLLLESAPYVLVRESFPAELRARVAVRREPGLGAYLVVEGERAERALLPLERGDAVLLARAVGAPEEDGGAPAAKRAARGAAGKAGERPEATTPERANHRREQALGATVDVLVRLAECAEALALDVELLLHLGVEPAVIAAWSRRAPSE